MSPPAHVAERHAPARPSRRVEPRIAAAKSKVIRAEGRRRLRFVLVALVLFALIIGGLVALHSSLFSARHVYVTGAVRTGEAEVLAVSGLGQRPPLIDIDVGADVAALKALPWVASAQVRRHWPDTVDVEISERRAVADVVVSAHEWALVDPTGRVLADVTSPPAGLVALAEKTAPAPGATLGATGRELAKVAAGLPRALAGSVAAVSHGSLGVVLQLRAGPSVVIGNTSLLGQKMVALATLSAHLALTGNEQVDLRVPSAPVLTP